MADGRSFLAEVHFMTLRTAILTATVALGTAGCASVDQFADRATGFNVEVAKAQDRTLLLNVLRAAHRLPMHFTELSTLSGTATVTRGLSLTLPFGGDATNLYGASPEWRASTSPTFNVAVLETQEFYKGVLAALTLEQWYLYIQEGLPRSLIFTLAFGRMVLKSDSDSIEIENNFHPRADVARCNAFACTGQALFADVIEALVNRGLTIEKIETAHNVGPGQPDKAFADPKALKELDAHGLVVNEVRRDDCVVDSTVCPGGEPSLTASERRMLHQDGRFFRVQKPVTTYRLCFREEEAVASLGQSMAKAVDPMVLKVKRARLHEYFCKSPARKRDVPQQARVAVEDVTFDLHLRSTEGVIYFLGEIARCQHNLEPPVHCSENQPSIRVAYQNEPSALFRVSRRSSPISVAFMGTDYSVAVDATGKDRSAQVLRILNQLLALNRSAKDFPAPAVVPLVSR